MMAGATPNPASHTSKQRWIASSKTALSITGDVVLTSDKLILAHKTFPLTSVREIGKEQLASVARIVDLSQPASSAQLFKTLIPRHSLLINSNTMCGPDNDATWMLAVYDHGSLSLAFFSDVAEPKLDYKVVEASQSLCGTYTYTAAQR